MHFAYWKHKARLGEESALVPWGLPTVVMLLLTLATTAAAQQEPMHFQHHALMPPGQIGGWRLRQGGPLPGYYQPAEIRAPSGAVIAMAQAGGFENPLPAPRDLGLLIGAVYRLRVARIPHHEGLEVFPTIELIDRVYPPVGFARKFPIPIELTQDDLDLALSGRFVTRVVYVEDPRTALPAAETGQQHWFDVNAKQDPLHVADALGRPVAIIRLGGRVPDAVGPDEAFLWGTPPYVTGNPVAAGATRGGAFFSQLERFEGVTGPPAPPLQR